MQNKVYVLLDTRNRILDINADLFLADTTGWVQIDEGDGDRYHHAQGNYLPGPLIDEQGRYRYKLVDGAVVERTAEEMEADTQPAASLPGDTVETRLDALESLTVDTQYQLALSQLGITEEV